MTTHHLYSTLYKSVKFTSVHDIVFHDVDTWKNVGIVVQKLVHGDHAKTSVQFGFNNVNTIVMEFVASHAYPASIVRIDISYLPKFRMQYDKVKQDI